MQRQATTSEVAQFLSISEDAVNGAIANGLFISTYDKEHDKHFLSLDECHWSWIQYVSKLCEYPDIDIHAKVEATDYVKSLRLQIIEEGSYFDGLQKIAEVRLSRDYIKTTTSDILKSCLVITLVVLLAVYIYISK